MASYEKRPAGWSVRFRCLDEAGTERQVRLSGFPTKREAREAYEGYINEHKAPQARSGSLRSVQELADAYLVYLQPIVKESSFYETAGRISRHILPTFGTEAPEKVTALEISLWQNDLIQRFSRPYLVSLRAAFTAMWNYGMAFHSLRNNPWPAVRLPKDKSVPKEMQIWTPEEFETFLSAVDAPLWRLFFRTLFLTGLRKGEALALSPSDVRGVTLSVTKNITRKTGTGAYAVTTPKTRGSVRKITIPADLAEELHVQRGPFIFGGEAPFSDRTVERYFKDWIAQADVTPIRIHDLRHSHASFLISSGCSIVAVSKRLGHSSVKQTLDTYSHVMQTDEDDIQNAVAAMDLVTDLVTNKKVLMLKKG